MVVRNPTPTTPKNSDSLRLRLRLRNPDYKSTSKNPKFGSEIPTSWENAQRVADLNKVHLHNKKRPFPRINTSEPTLLATRKDHGRQENDERIGSIHIMSEKL